MPEQQKKAVRQEVDALEEAVFSDVAPTTDTEYENMKRLLLVPSNDDLGGLIPKKVPSDGLQEGIWRIPALDGRAAVDNPSKG
jgi:hypothetical protein